MRGTDLIGYAYEAALHCVDCALERWAGAVQQAEREHFDCDEHGLPLELLDSEGNPLTPIFVTTELEPTDTCDGCGRGFE